jgi:hypothetical protein
MESQSQPSFSSVPQPEPHDETERTLPRYVSFVLRCRTTADGQVWARLSEVRSGLTRSVNDLDELPDLVRRWMAGDPGP